MQAEQHVRLVGILMVVYSILMFGIGLTLSFIRDVPGNIAGLRIVAFVAAVVILAAGIGLLARQSWSRILAFVAAVLALVSFPIGTALGIYAFWVLTRPEAVAALGRRAA